MFVFKHKWETGRLINTNSSTFFQIHINYSYILITLFYTPRFLFIHIFYLQAVVMGDY